LYFELAKLASHFGHVDVGTEGLEMAITSPYPCRGAGRCFCNRPLDASLLIFFI